MQKFISKLSPNEKKIFYVTVAIVTFAMLDRLFFGPVLSRIKGIDDEIKAQQSSIQRDLRFLAFKSKINDESQDLKKYMSSKKMAEDDINTEIFSRIEKIANQNSVSLIKSNPTTPLKQDNFTQYYANVECAGSLKDVTNFMYTINTTDELFKIVKYSMTPKKGSETDVNLTLTIAKLVVSPET